MNEIVVDWDEVLKTLLKERGYGYCPNCNREIDRGDVAWNNHSIGTDYCVVQIQCQACDTEIVHIDSWYPEIEDIEDLCHVIAWGLREKQ